MLWSGKRHPAEMGAGEVEGFWTWLAVERAVVATTQNQALNALIFLYKEVLKIELAGIAAQRAKHSRRLPVVLTTEEVGRLMKTVKGEAGMVCRLLYGCGLTHSRPRAHSPFGLPAGSLSRACLRRSVAGSGGAGAAGEGCGCGRREGGGAGRQRR